MIESRKSSITLINQNNQQLTLVLYLIISLKQTQKCLKGDNFIWKCLTEPIQTNCLEKGQGFKNIHLSHNTVAKCVHDNENALRD